jgi:hypothetical protein
LIDLYYHDDITDAVILLGLSGSLRQSQVFFNGAWLRLFKSVHVLADVATGATTLYVDNSSGFQIGDSIAIVDDVNSETKTISTLPDTKTITLTTGTTYAYTASRNARISANGSQVAQQALHLGARNDWTSYLKHPVWCGGGDLFTQEVLFQTIGGVDGMAAFSINDVNHAYYRDNGGTLSAYRAVTGASVCVQHDRLWLAGDSELENIIMYSQKYNNLFYDIGAGNVPFLNYIGISGDSSGSGSIADSIVKIIPWANEILVLKGKSVHKIVGQDRLSFQSVQLTDKAGCDSIESVVSTKAGIMWKDGENVYLYNGQINNVSVPRVARAMSRSNHPRVKAGYSQDRFYVISINDFETFRFDVEMSAWSFENVNYEAFTTNGPNLYAINRGRDAIIMLDKGYTREANTDGTGGTAYDFLIELPFIDCGSRAVDKIFTEMAVHARLADPALTAIVDFDGMAQSEISGSADPAPVWQESNYGGADNNPRTRYRADDYNKSEFRKFDFEMPLESRCYAMAASIKKIAPEGNVRIGAIILYFIPCRSANQEDGE